MQKEWLVKARYRATIQVEAADPFPIDIIEAVLAHHLANASVSLKVSSIKVSKMDAETKPGEFSPGNVG